jgi:hypothetical protein
VRLLTTPTYSGVRAAPPYQTCVQYHRTIALEEEFIPLPRAAVRHSKINATKLCGLFGRSI